MKVLNKFSLNCFRYLLMVIILIKQVVSLVISNAIFDQLVNFFSTQRFKLLCGSIFFKIFNNKLSAVLH
uniref:Putative secreted protein n=1 Tax=Panstrongylus lignarius TaxID=156445 RepID=A0A224Y1B7_9HEMI